MNHRSQVVPAAGRVIHKLFKMHLASRHRTCHRNADLLWRRQRTALFFLSRETLIRVACQRERTNLNVNDWRETSRSSFGGRDRFLEATENNRLVSGLWVTSDRPKWMSGRKLETRCSNSDPRCPIPDNGFGAANNSKINVSANQKREKLAKLKIKENKNLFQEREREKERDLLSRIAQSCETQRRF